MSEKVDEKFDDNLSSTGQSHEPGREDPLGSANELISHAVPPGVDRRTFMMRSAVVGAAAVIAGRQISAQERHQRAAASPAPNLNPTLFVVKSAKGPVMTLLDEFYKVGPGPSSSHTIGPMRITYDFYQRCTKLPADRLANATALKVNLFGSLSATGKDMEQNGPLWPVWWGKSPQLLIRRSWMGCAISLISRSR